MSSVLRVSSEDFDFFRQVLWERTRISLSPTKLELIQSRLAGRLRALGLESWGEYRAVLSSAGPSDPEWQAFINAMTTNKTDFFRESEHFQLLVNRFVPEFRARRGNKARFRVWSAACSTGEEPYSLAMTLQAVPGLDFEILASDIDTDVLASARNGVYPRERIETQIPKAMQRGAVEFGTGGIANWARMSNALKQRIRFKQHNLMKPLSGEDPFDVIFCRNVLYYFDAEAMLNAVRILHSHVVPSGTLVLSHAETLQNLDVPWCYLMPSVYTREAGAKQVPALNTRDTSAKQASVKPLVVLPQRRARTRILIVEDSGTMQKLVALMLAKDPDFEVVGVAATVADALAKLEALKPDVVTLDMNLEGETGLDFLKRVGPKSRVPTVLVTALAREEAPMVLEALENGASEYVQKPTMQDIDKVAMELCEKIRAVRGARRGRARVKPTKATAPSHSTVRADAELIAIGASTGGTEAVREFLEALPSQIPPIVVVQHIPPVFSKAFADRLNTLFPFEVKEAASGDAVRPGRVLIAPGGKQMRLARGSGGFVVTLTDEPPVSGHCPSVDVLFESVAKLAGPQSAGVLLTGMGRDGAQGLLAMKAARSRTFAQDEESCVVFGMPRAAIELGAAECVASLEDLPRKVWSVLRSKRTA